MTIREFLRLANEAQRHGARSVMSQAIEILRLRLGMGRLGLSEYYNYRLWDCVALDRRAKEAFAGYRAQAVLEELLIDDYSKFLSLDKLTFDALMRAHRFPIPKLLAVFSERRRNVTAPVVTTPSALAEHLRNSMPYPCYCKPSFGGYGRGNELIQAYFSETDSLRLANDTSVTVDAFTSGLQDRTGLGVMFQEALRPHPSITEMCGDRICGVRVHVLLGPRGPHVFRAVWKVATGTNVVDNFQHGASGNMLGAVDVNTGRVIRVVAGTGATMRVNPVHPDTEQQLAGFCLPDWSRMIDTVIEASTVFPGFLAQGWDVALCTQGPVLMEVNMLGDVDLSQHAFGMGFMDEEFFRFADEIGVVGLLRGGSRRARWNANNGRFGRRKAHWRY